MSGGGEHGLGRVLDGWLLIMLRKGYYDGCRRLLQAGTRSWMGSHAVIDRSIVDGRLGVFVFVCMGCLLFCMHPWLLDRQRREPGHGRIRVDIDLGFAPDPGCVSDGTGGSGRGSVILEDDLGLHLGLRLGLRRRCHDRSDLVRMQANVVDAVVFPGEESKIGKSCSLLCAELKRHTGDLDPVGQLINGDERHDRAWFVRTRAGSDNEVLRSRIHDEWNLTQSAGYRLWTPKR